MWYWFLAHLMYYLCIGFFGVGLGLTAIDFEQKPAAWSLFLWAFNVWLWHGSVTKLHEQRRLAQG